MSLTSYRAAPPRANMRWPLATLRTYACAGNGKAPNADAPGLDLRMVATTL